MNLNTKIKNLLNAVILKKAFAISTIVLVLFMTLDVNQVAQAASTATQVPASQRCSASGGASSTFSNETVELCGTVAQDPTNNNLYKFNATVTDDQSIVDINSGESNDYYYDRTADFTYSWTIMSGNTVAQKMNNSNATFYDGLATLATGNYQVVLIATAQQNSDGIPAGSTILTTNIPLSISTGKSAGTLATITSVKATGQVDPNTHKSSYEMIAQLTGANGCIESGGSQGSGTPCTDNTNTSPNNNGYTWTWTAKYATGNNTGQPYPLTNPTGFDVTNSFDPGSYYLQATATPANGSPVSTNTTTDPLATLNAGSLNGNTLTIACTRNGTTGVSYQCVATPSISNGQSSAYNFAWTVNGTTLSNNGFNVPVTFVAGQVNTVAVVMKSNTDGSTTAQNISYTLDLTGAVTATNGNTAVTTASPDACSISASGVACIVGKVIGSVLGFITEMMGWLTAKLLLPITENVLSITPHTSAFSAVIIQEWVFIRNFCNIFFIATLIMLGIGTLLRVGPSDPGKILPKLVGSALLINFSLAIAQAILGVADVFQAQFLGMCTSATTATCQSTVVLENLAYRLMTAPLAHITAGAAQSITGLSVALVTEVVYFLIAIMAMFVFVALTAYLVIRIVALWLLLMTSPIAFATSFVPNKTISGLGSAWWSNFFKYAFFTPIIALCLHICALLANAQSTFVQGSITNQVANQVASGTGNLQTAVSDILTAFLVAACLGAALSIAQKMGIKGADAVTKAYGSVQSKVFGAPVAGAKWAADYAGKKTMREIREKSYNLVNDKDGNVRTGLVGRLGRTVNAITNPDAMLKSWKKDFEGKNKAAQEQSQALSDRLQLYNQTGADNKADVNLLKKADDARQDKYKDMEAGDLLRNMNNIRDRIASSKIPGGDRAAKQELMAMALAVAEKDKVSAISTEEKVKEYKENYKKANGGKDPSEEEIFKETKEIKKKTGVPEAQSKYLIDNYLGSFNKDEKKNLTKKWTKTAKKSGNMVSANLDAGGLDKPYDAREKEIGEAQGRTISTMSDEEWDHLKYKTITTAAEGGKAIYKAMIEKIEEDPERIKKLNPKGLEYFTGAEKINKLTGDLISKNSEQMQRFTELAEKPETMGTFLELIKKSLGSQEPVKKPVAYLVPIDKDKPNGPFNKFSYDPSAKKYVSVAGSVVPGDVQAVRVGTNVGKKTISGINK